MGNWKKDWSNVKLKKTIANYHKYKMVNKYNITIDRLRVAKPEEMYPGTEFFFNVQADPANFSKWKVLDPQDFDGDVKAFRKWLTGKLREKRIFLLK